MDQKKIVSFFIQITNSRKMKKVPGHGIKTFDRFLETFSLKNLLEHFPENGKIRNFRKMAMETRTQIFLKLSIFFKTLLKITTF